MKYPTAKRRKELAILFAKAHPHYSVLKNGNILYNKPNDKWWMWNERDPSKFGKRLVEAKLIVRNGGKGTHWHFVATYMGKPFPYHKKPTPKPQTLKPKTTELNNDKRINNLNA